MFGIQSMIIKIVIIIAGAVMLVCVATVVGCTPVDSAGLSQSQAALAVKNNVDSSKEDNRQDNSIVLAIPDVAGRQGEESAPPAPLPVSEMNSAVAVKLVGARGDERAKVILAQAEMNEKIIRAREEKWRLLVWVLGVGSVIVGALALLIRSPLDKKGV